MKQSLDLGTLLSSDNAKLRAYKERVKETFQNQWLSIAEALESLEMIVPCECFATNEFCRICGGSRYQMSEGISPSVLREFALITSKDDSEIAKRLQEGLAKALEELHVEGA